MNGANKRHILRKKSKKHLTIKSTYDIVLKHWRYAGVAQLVEQLICNQQVRGSSPFTSSKLDSCSFKEWLST